MSDRMKLTRNGDIFEAGELFAVAHALSEYAEHLYQREAYESSLQNLKLAGRFFSEYGDYHSAQECRKKQFEYVRSQRLKHEKASRITNSVMASVEHAQPQVLRFKRKDVGIWTALVPGFGKRPTIQFTIERQGDNWVAKTSKSVRGHGYVPVAFQSASSLRAAKLACEQSLEKLCQE